MAKYSTSFILLISICLFLAAINEPQMAEAKLCKKYSGTWSGWCTSSSGCDKKCKGYERAKSGSCEWDSRGRACFCYFQC